jgi:hypothetical protein
MKKNILITVLAALITTMLSTGSYGQLFTNLNIGYGLGKSTSNLPFWGFHNYTQNSVTSYTEEQIFLSLGKGLNFGATIGNMFNEHVGAELGFNYLMGGKSKASDEYMNGAKTDYVLMARMGRVIPAVVIAAGGEKIDPYAKFGVVISLGSVKYEIEDNNNGNVSIDKWCYSGCVALGFMGAVGAKFPLSNNMRLFAEINTINLSYAPKKGELKESTVNGEDRLPDLSTREKEIEFVDQITYDYEGGNQSDSDPTQILKQKFPLGSVGINLGLEIWF